jgi:hypothetical protein
VLTACSTVAAQRSGSAECRTLVKLYLKPANPELTLTAIFDTSSDVRVLTTQNYRGIQTTEFKVKGCGGLALRFVAHFGIDTLASLMLEKPHHEFRQWEAIARLGGSDPRKPPHELEGMVRVECAPLKQTRSWPGTDTLWVYWVGAPF